jgi:acyl-CoA thioester hydrolase
MGEFNFETELTVRFRDIDLLGHVNNAVYSTYLEQARVEYIETVVGESLAETGVVIADLHVDFADPIDRGESVTVTARVGDLGTSSFPMEQEIRVDGTVAATAEALMVTYDADAGEPRPIPDGWRERIRAYEDRQPESTEE